MAILSKIFGSRNQRVLRQMSKQVKQVNALEAQMQACSEPQLRAKTAEFRQRLQAGEHLDQILPEAFAVVREAALRVLGLRHFDVQLIGGMVLHTNKIAEMRTGEGKTLVATLAAYLNALTGKGVHIVTVNDYLAQRDAEWMRPIYTYLGLSTGVIIHGLSQQQRQAAYGCDITYGTNNEFGFDYLRDNMMLSLAEKVQRPLHFAIVDEVDSILIDEARTPLIISGMSHESSELYQRIDKLIPDLVLQEQEEGSGDYHVDEKARQAFLTEAGQQKVEHLLRKSGFLPPEESLYAATHIGLLHYVNAALRAHKLYKRDVDYLVKDGKVIIVDEHTGRMMPGRRWSDGLHQAVEAKEGVKVENENQTLASITFQNYFRLYEKLGGMTGTADTEAYEFQQIYGLEVVAIPPNRTMIRHDHKDVIYLQVKDKFAAIVDDVQQAITQQRPVLLGTVSIENSEYLSRLLQQKGITHQVLNAKLHEQEARIIAQAGYPGAVTIATNMAGRGTDIVLGGNVEAELAALGEELDAEQKAKVVAAWQVRHDTVIKAGGLHIIGSERHESRRIDNQLRGRAGRQGDPGSSRFYLSLEDNLIRIFASDRMAALMQRFGMQEGVALESGMLTRRIEGAQRKVEGHNFDIRKQLLEYDNVANEQRQVIYQQRDEILAADDIADMIKAIRDDVVELVVRRYIPVNSIEQQWDMVGLEQQLVSDFNLHLPLRHWLEEDATLHEETLLEQIRAAFLASYAEKEKQITAAAMRQFEKAILLQTLDTHWKEHLAAMDYLRQGIHLRGYAQKNPKQEYKRESFELFAEMLDAFKYEVISLLSCVAITEEDAVHTVEQQQRQALEHSHYEYHHDSNVTIMPESLSDDYPQEAHDPLATYVREQPKVGRNEPCPCHSGKKYKHCHGQLN